MWIRRNRNNFAVQGATIFSSRSGRTIWNLIGQYVLAPKSRVCIDACDWISLSRVMYSVTGCSAAVLSCFALLAALLAYFVSNHFFPQQTKIMGKFDYPEARRDESVVDDYHGTKVSFRRMWHHVSKQGLWLRLLQLVTYLQMTSSFIASLRKNTGEAMVEFFFTV